MTAKLFQNGRSQAVRLPKAFRFEGTEVRIRRTRAGAVVLEPMNLEETERKSKLRAFDVWLAKVDKYNRELGPFMPDGRPPQPPMPEDDFSFD